MHRAVVNSEKERISIPTFYCPSPDAVIGPAPQLVTDDEPAVYRQFTFEEYNRTIWTGGLHKCLDAFHAT
ncbi:putative flavanone 3-dioxygenase [Helianthus annuus]|nr:putative flavanone 3-dioxygenase [Helianthus annuus]